MLTVLMLTIILTVIGIAAITTTTLDMKMAGSEKMRESAESAAEACMSSGVQIIQQTLANSVIPAALTAGGTNPTVTVNPLQSEIMGYPGFLGLGDSAAPGGAPNAVLSVPTVNPLFTVNMDIDRLYAKLGAGAAAQASGGYEGTGGAAGVDILFRIDCYAMNANAATAGQQVATRITGVYLCRQTGDTCQRKI